MASNRRLHSTQQVRFLLLSGFGLIVSPRRTDDEASSGERGTPTFRRKVIRDADTEIMAFRLKRKKAKPRPRPYIGNDDDGRSELVPIPKFIDRPT